MHNKKLSKRIPARSKRYSPAMKQEILRCAAEQGPAETMRKYGCSVWTICRWQRQAQRATAKATPARAFEPGQVSVPDPTPLPEGSNEAERHALGQAPSSSLTIPLCGIPNIENSPAPDLPDAQREEAMPSNERHQLILNTWQQHPLLGPSQIKNQLRRLGYKMSVNTVRNLMEEHGYVTPRIKRKEHTGSYEAVRPRQLYHFDFFHLYVHKQKQVLLFIEDDFSRFIAGWTLVESENADAVIDALEKAIARYGKPEAVMSDRGTAFYSWAGVTRFENLLVEYGIDYFVAREPQPNGKVEALTQEEFAKAAEIPIDTLRTWLAQDRAPLLPENATPKPKAIIPVDAAEIVRQIVERFEKWQGSTRDFMRHATKEFGLKANQIKRVLCIVGMLSLPKPHLSLSWQHRTARARNDAGH